MRSEGGYKWRLRLRQIVIDRKLKKTPLKQSLAARQLKPTDDCKKKWRP